MAKRQARSAKTATAPKAETKTSEGVAEAAKGVLEVAGEVLADGAGEVAEVVANVAEVVAGTLAGRSHEAAATPPAPQPDPRLLDLDNRERRLAERERALMERDRGLTEREAQLGQAFVRMSAREEALARLQEDLSGREAALGERDEDLSIREAALEEAMALAAEMDEAQPSLEGAAEEVGDLLEGPAEIGLPPEDEGPPPPLVSVSAEEVRKAEETRKADEARRADEAKRVKIEAEQLMGLLADVPFLQFVEPRVKRAVADGTLDLASLLGFYGLVSRLMKDELDKGKLLIQRYETDFQNDLRDKDKALIDAKAAVTSLQEDFDRYRNRAKAEQEGMTGRASEELLRRVVPIFDNFERALAASAGSSNMEAVVNGVQMIYRQFEDVLRQEGLVAIRVHRGEEFNPKIHEALMEVETTEVPEDVIYDEIQRGYMLAGRLFRPALVKVARKPAG